MIGIGSAVQLRVSEDHSPILVVGEPGSAIQVKKTGAPEGQQMTELMRANQYYT